MYRPYDLDNWKRKPVFHFFRNFDDPFFNITANLDVTALYDFCKKQNLAYSLACLYFSLKTANEIEEFRLRLVDNELVIFDTIHAGQTLLHDDDTFSFCYFGMKPSVFEFVAEGRKNIEAQLEQKKLEPRDHDHGLIHYSVIPWVSFTSIKHAKRLGSHDTIPKIVFGKMFEENGRRKMPLSVEVNHAMMDGVHVGKYFNRFQELISRQ